MANVLAGGTGIALSAEAVRRLLERGDGDAALLYLAVLRRQGDARSLAGDLGWDRARMEAAGQVLRDLGLLDAPEDAPSLPADEPPVCRRAVGPAPSPPSPLPADEPPAYQSEDLLLRLEDGGGFRRLADQVEQRLGKKLTTPDLSKLLGLYDHLGLPPYVIYQLVNHCMERTAARYGAGRRPTMRQIEQEGYRWAERGILDQEAVEAYLKRYARDQGQFASFMRALGMEGRTPVPSEEKYLSAWMEMGFPPETVALAYDRTVFHCHEFRWGYCNGILRRWHTAGLHTPRDVQDGDRPQEQGARPDASRAEEMRRYV